MHPVWPKRLIVVSYLSSFLINGWYLLVLLLIPSYLVHNDFPNPVLIVHSCLLWLILLIWSHFDTTGVWSVLSFLFNHSFLVWSFDLFPILTLVNFPLSELIFLLLYWFSPSASILEIILKGILEFWSPFKIPHSFVCSHVSYWYYVVNLFP